MKSMFGFFVNFKPFPCCVHRH